MIDLVEEWLGGEEITDDKIEQFVNQLDITQMNRDLIFNALSHYINEGFFNE